MDHEVSMDVSELSGQRGPADHKRRQQILDAADEHFKLYGYRKTTLADVAKSIKLSTPYLYKFFESKQAIGEAICSQCLGTILSAIEDWVAETKSPVEKLRRVFLGLEKNSWRLLNEQRKMHDLVSASCEEKWSSVDRFKENLYQLIRAIVLQGRESGEFERKTPLDEVCRAISSMTMLYFHPTLLEQAEGDQSEEALAVANVAVRSLTA